MTSKTDATEVKLNRGRIIIRPNEYVSCKKTIYKITQIIDFETVVGIDIKTNNAATLQINSISALDPEKITDNGFIHRDIEDLADSDWQEIESRFECIKPLLNGTTKKKLQEHAIKHGIHYTTLYRWLKNYHSTGTLTGLLPKKTGDSSGAGRIPLDAESIITKVINEYYLTQQRPLAQRVIELVNIECHNLNIDPPSKNTIRTRINKISEYERLRKQGNRSKAQTKYKPASGTFPNADYPLAVVQIDHTPMDIILVDDDSRLPIGRPWITLAIDVYSRMIVGYYLSLDAPSSTSVAMCIAHSVLPKEDWLLLHNVGADWPVWGFMQTIHVDNGADFRAETLRKSCLTYNINLEFRPVGLPNFGGHIERLLGTVLKHVHSLPGTTFSSIKEKDNYDSDKHACMTFSEFERWLVTYITMVYHKRVHSTLGMSPEQKWKIGIFGDLKTQGVGYLPKPSDFQTVMIDFLPMFSRSIQKNGVNIDGLNYYDNVLRPLINSIDEDSKKKKKYIFRRDPRNISYIWFYEEKGQKYYKLPLANQSIPAMNLWEYSKAKEHLKEQGLSNASDHSLITALANLNKQAEESAKKSKQARRTVQNKKVHINSQTITTQQSAPEKSTSKDEVFWDDDVEAFD